MPSTTTYRFGDVVLVPFPFSDLTQSKKRPATIVSSDAYNTSGTADVIVMAITSNVEQGRRFGSVPVHDWQASGLPKPSVTKPAVATLERGRVLKRLGHLDARTKKGIRVALRRILG